MDTSYFYAQYGIDPANLSADTKKKVNDILAAMGYAGLDKLGKIIQEEADKQTGTTGKKPQTDTVIDTSAQQVLEAEKARKDQQRMYIIVGSVVGVMIVGVIVFLAMRKDKQHGRANYQQ